MNKYVIIGVVIVLGLLVGNIKVITIENKKLKDKIELLDNNNYAYEQDIISLQDSINKEKGVYTLTVKELKNSQNNILKELNDTRKELKIKDKELEQMAYFNANIKTDTIISIANIINDSCEFNLNIEYNPQTVFKVSNTKINGKDSLRHSSDISASFNAYLYTKSSWKEPNFFKRLFLFKWGKKHIEKSILKSDNNLIQIKNFKVIKIKE